METTILLVQRLSACAPRNPASPRKSSFDLCSTIDAVIPAHGHADVSMVSPERIPPGLGGRITSRTSLAAIEYIKVIDARSIPSTPRGRCCEVSATLQNDSSADFKIRRGDRVAQLIISA